MLVIFFFFRYVVRFLIHDLLCQSIMRERMSFVPRNLREQNNGSCFSIKVKSIKYDDDDKERTAKRTTTRTVYFVLSPNRLSSYTHTLSQWNPSYFKGTHTRASIACSRCPRSACVRACACYILLERSR